MFNLPLQVKTAITKLTDSGFQAYLVGGSVRDFLLKTPTSDYDIATSATPDQMIKVFEDYKVKETGIKHGTLTVIIDNLPLEITTFRIDGKYDDNRHPDNVYFTESIENDLARRDFTINSMAYNESFGILDPFSGAKDLEKKLIRCVGEPDKRFKEDALRIMRALRFSSVLGFEIEEQTSKSIFENKELLHNVSSERVSAELTKLVMGNNSAQIITKYFSVLTVILPELEGTKDFDQQNPHHIYDVLTHTAISTQKAAPVAHIKLAMLFHDCGKPEAFFKDKKGIGHFKGHSEISFLKTEKALNRLKFDNLTIEKTLKLIKYHDYNIKPTKPEVKKLLKALTPQLFFDLLEVKRADTMAKSEKTFYRLKEFENLRNLAEEIIASGECFTLSSLAINGNDLKVLGFNPDKSLGETLDYLLNEVIFERLPNRRCELIKHLKEKF